MRCNERIRCEQRSVRAAFTLIELLVVISIVAILSALLLGGIQSATVAVANTKAANELNSLSTGLAQFHSEFGMYPPSSIVLYEVAANWSGDVRSTALIRKYWPDFNFAVDRDINGDGDKSDTLTLDGRECLVFFLGGMSKNGGAIGFAKNPANPFSRTGSNRVGPFHEFVNNRFVDTDSDKMSEYVDTYSGQTTPILYLSSYDGRGYRAADAAPFLSNGPYLQGSATGTPWKSKTYQLISPGQDTLYGTGGWYDPDGNDAISDDDKDNLTNFSSGRLR